MIIQLVLIPAVVLAVVLSLRSRQSLRGQARRKIFAAITVVAGVVAVTFPDLLQVIADWVGVTRGVDLMLYALVLIIIYLIGSTSVRFREQEARLVRLARELALAEAEPHRAELEPRPGPPPAAAPPPAGTVPTPAGAAAPEDSQSSRRTSHQ